MPLNSGSSLCLLFLLKMVGSPMVWINVYTNGLKMVLFRVFWEYTWMMSFVEEKANL